MKILTQDPLGISFMEILLDETICQGVIAVPKDLVLQAGGYNHKLKAKQKYEMILRIAKASPIALIEQKQEVPQDKYIVLKDHVCEDKNAEWQTDCYIIGKYSKELRESGFFDLAVSNMIKYAEAEGRMQQTLNYLEEMIGHKEQYYCLDDATRPVLIYKGDSVCHNILTVMAEQFGNALEQLCIPVIYFDCQKEKFGELADFMYKHFRAVVGIQSYMFSIKQKDEVHYVHDKIYGPKYNFVFDHPIWFRNHLTHHLKDFYILALDSNYEIFYKQYFHKNAVLFPPAGMMLETDHEPERIYDLTFVGRYGDYWNEILFIHNMERKKRFLANHFLSAMRKNPGLTAEDAFRQTLHRQGMIVTAEQFLDLFYEMRRVIYCVMSYYRDRVMQTILQSGIQLHVFGNSWGRSPLKQKYSNLICHPDVSIEECLAIWRQSKLSLNIMSWHKAGFTERMAGIMLAGAVLVTDNTSYLQGRYDDGDLVEFYLDSLQKLPEKIIQLLNDEERRQVMAENGRRKTLQEHTWKKRAEQFVELLDNLR